MNRLVTSVLTVALVAHAPQIAAAFAVAEGGEFHVNSYTTDYQIQQRVCGNDDGSFVVAWQSYYQDGDEQGIFAQRFSSDGSAAGTEFQVNTYATGSQFTPNLCCSPDGFVVVWSSGHDGSSYGIFGQRFLSDGTAAGTEFQLNSYTTGFQAAPAPCCAADGSFVVAWSSGGGRDGDSDGVFGRRFLSDGTAASTEFQVNTYTTDRQSYPVISCDGSANFVVAWNSGPTLSDRDVRARRFDSSGTPQGGGDFVVNSYTTGEQGEPSLCHDGAGDFVVVWQSGVVSGNPPNADGSAGGVFGQRYDSSGTPDGTEFLVNVSFTSGQQRDPAVTCRDGGDFTVAYTDGGYGAYEEEIRGQRFDASGQSLGTHFRVNTYSANYQCCSEVARTGNDGFVVVWRSVDQESSYDYGGIYGQRFSISSTTTTTLPYGGVAQPDGGEFQINTFTTGDQYPEPNRAVARGEDGSFVVVWKSASNQDGSGDGIFGQRFDERGADLGTEFRINDYTTGNQADPAVAMLADGSFVVVWESGQDGDGLGIFGQRFDSQGVAVGTEFQANSYTTNLQFDPDVAGGSDGAFVVVWQGGGSQDGNLDGVFGQRFASDGSAAGSEFQVNTYTTDDQSWPAVAREPGSGFVVAWINEEYSGYSGFNVTAQRFDDAGSPAGTEFVASTYTSAAQTFPAVDMDADGRFVVVWDRFYEEGFDDFGAGIFGQRFDSDGTPLGTEMHVNAHVADNQRRPDVAVNDDGTFMVVWQSDNYFDFSGYAVAGRFFDSDGSPRGDNFQINAYTIGDQFESTVAGDGVGNFVVVWRNGRPQDGSGDGVFGQLFCADANADGICDNLVCAQAPSGQDIDIKPRIVLSRINTDATTGNDRLTLKGELLLPLSTGFSSLDPGAKGARILLETNAGLPAVDVTLPGGPEWKTNGAGSKWTYKDKAGANNGIVKMLIKDRRTVGPNQIKFVAKGKDGDYPVVAGDEPLQAIVVFGDAAAGADGECGRTSFGTGDCAFNGKANKLRCKQ